MDPDIPTRRAALLLQLADVDATLQSLQREQDAFRVQRNGIARELNELLSQSVAARLAHEEAAVARFAQEENQNHEVFSRLVEEERQAERDHEMADRPRREDQSAAGASQPQGQIAGPGASHVASQTASDPRRSTALALPAKLPDCSPTAPSSSKKPDEGEPDTDPAATLSQVILVANKRVRIDTDADGRLDNEFLAALSMNDSSISTKPGAISANKNVLATTTHKASDSSSTIDCTCDN